MTPIGGLRSVPSAKLLNEKTLVKKREILVKSLATYLKNPSFHIRKIVCEQILMLLSFGSISDILLYDLSSNLLSHKTDS